MVFPVLIGFIFMKSKNIITRILASTLVLIFIGAIVLSYTRAAWLSLFGALGVFIIIILRIRFKHLLLMAAVIAIVIASSWTRIMIKLEKNRSDSSDYLAEHVQSMSNVSTDASNLERINRWSCALRMFEDKPFFGWGPGTYKFEYAPYQLSYQKTIISTNAGIRGNAHSEYIGPLSESGFLGMLTFTLIVIMAIITGVKVYFKVQNKDLRIYTLCIFLGLITYIIHGFLNNFLDTDKASALFWGYIAMLVTIDLYHTGKNPGEIKYENQ
jgi:O-antigen ligase